MWVDGESKDSLVRASGGQYANPSIHIPIGVGAWCFYTPRKAIMATSLIPVFTGVVSGKTINLCNARTLHDFLRVKRDFTTWMKARIGKFGFVENEDYLLTKSGEQLPSGTKYAHDYHLTLDMAKELSMVENNEQGRAARRYFIACERKLLEQANAGIPGTLYEQALQVETKEAKSFALAQAGSRAMLLRKSEKKDLLETVALMREAIQLRLALGYSTHA